MNLIKVDRAALRQAIVAYGQHCENIGRLEGSGASVTAMAADLDAAAARQDEIDQLFRAAVDVDELWRAIENHAISYGDFREALANEHATNAYVDRTDAAQHATAEQVRALLGLPTKAITDNCPEPA